MLNQELFSNEILPIAIFLIMMGIGTGLRVENFSAIFRYPKSIFVGLGGQMIYLPAVAFLLALLLPLDPVYKVGLIILAACPGGSASNLITYILNAKVALSVSLTALNSILIVFTIPVFVGLAQAAFMSQFQPIELPFWSTVMDISITVILPVAIGVALNHLFNKFMEKLQSVLKYVMVSILLVVFIGVFLASEDGESVSLFSQPWILLAAFILNFFAFFGGVFISNFFNLSSKEKVTIGIEVGLQNSALAIFVGASLLESQEMALVAVMYSLFSFFTTALYAYFSLYWIRWKGIASRFKGPKF